MSLLNSSWTQWNSWRGGETVNQGCTAWGMGIGFCLILLAHPQPTQNHLLPPNPFLAWTQHIPCASQLQLVPGSLQRWSQCLSIDITGSTALCYERHKHHNLCLLYCFLLCLTPNPRQSNSGAGEGQHGTPPLFNGGEVMML